jgi:hypothetical protein
MLRIRKTGPLTRRRVFWGANTFLPSPGTTYFQAITADFRFRIAMNRFSGTNEIFAPKKLAFALNQ